LPPDTFAKLTGAPTFSGIILHTAFLFEEDENLVS